MMRCGLECGHSRKWGAAGITNNTHRLIKSQIRDGTPCTLRNTECILTAEKNIYSLNDSDSDQNVFILCSEDEPQR